MVLSSGINKSCRFCSLITHSLSKSNIPKHKSVHHSPHHLCPPPLYICDSHQFPWLLVLLELDWMIWLQVCIVYGCVNGGMLLSKALMRPRWGDDGPEVRAKMGEGGVQIEMPSFRMCVPVSEVNPSSHSQFASSLSLALFLSQYSSI